MTGKNVEASYGIRTALNRTIWDWEIPLASKSFELPPQPLSVIASFALSITILSGLLMQVFSLASIPWKIVFALWWIIMTVFLFTKDATGETRVTRIPTFLAFVPRKSREVMTRSSSDAGAFHSIVGIDSIEKNGRIYFKNGEVGAAYLVSGAASNMVFPEDIVRILEHTRNFWRSLEEDVDYIILTTKESQRVERPVAELVRLSKNFTADDDDMVYLLEERLRLMRDYVGRESKSIHQYLVLRTSGVEKLRRAQSMIRLEVETGEGRTLRTAELLNDVEVTEMLSTLYTYDRR